jgi:hypothetical protein
VGVCEEWGQVKRLVSDVKAYFVLLIVRRSVSVSQEQMK